MKLLALAASTRANSLNKKLLALAIAHARNAGATVTEYDYAACEAPLYQGQDNPEIPANIAQFATVLMAQDGLLLASPEYNWSIPAALKNLIDWLSIHPAAPLKHRHALLMCASPSVRGGILGLQQLSVPLGHLGVHVYPHWVAVGDAENQLEADKIRNEKDHAFLTQCVCDFVERIQAIARG